MPARSSDDLPLPEGPISRTIVFSPYLTDRSTRSTTARTSAARPKNTPASDSWSGDSPGYGGRSGLQRNWRSAPSPRPLQLGEQRFRRGDVAAQEEGLAVTHQLGGSAQRRDELRRTHQDDFLAERPGERHLGETPPRLAPARTVYRDDNVRAAKRAIELGLPVAAGRNAVDRIKIDEDRIESAAPSVPCAPPSNVGCRCGCS